MKQKRKLFFAFLGIVFAFVLSGCSVIDIYKGYADGGKDYYVAFSKEEEKAEPFDHHKIDGYKAELSRYNSYILYQTLSEKEKKIYRFYEYALDHGYTSVFIDSGLMEGLEVTPLEILSFFTMDSALVPQNYKYTTSETGYTFSYFFGLLTFDVDGLQISTDLFDGKKLEKRKEVLPEAKKIRDQMPKGLSDLEKARYFYRYLTGEVEYYLYEEASEKPDYLYDAFFQKRTQCDGYANAFSLFCALEGIPCFEKIYSGQEDEELGHTWNCFYAEGKWYNADCAVSKTIVENQNRFGMDFYFGFSDERQDEQSQFAARLPSCTNDLIPVDLVISSSSDPAMRSKIGKAFAASQSKGILIRIENGTLKDNDLGRIADYLNADLYSIPEVWNGVNHLYLFRDE